MQGSPRSTAQLRAVVALWLTSALTGCKGPLSALDPAGRDAEKIANLFYVMVGGAVIVWLVVITLAIVGARTPPDTPSPKRARLLIIGGGTLFPTIVLTALLAYGLAFMPELLDHGPEDGVKIRVSGEQWWWRVHYELPDGRRFELANELRIPVNERSPLYLEAADVIHSLWVPSIAGKIDMIPGRVNRMALEPTRTGKFRGACAEYCGSAHARMMFDVVVLERAAFDDWLVAQQEPAKVSSDPAEQRGSELFLSVGCSACHTVRGTAAKGVIGPDLTHVGGRTSIGAGTLPNDVNGFRRWLTELHHIKPGVRMPTFSMLPREEQDALAAYLESLE